MSTKQVIFENGVKILNGFDSLTSEEKKGYKAIAKAIKGVVKLETTSITFWADILAKHAEKGQLKSLMQIRLNFEVPKKRDELSKIITKMIKERAAVVDANGMILTAKSFKTESGERITYFVKKESFTFDYCFTTLFAPKKEQRVESIQTPEQAKEAYIKAKEAEKIEAEKIEAEKAKAEKAEKPNKTKKQTLAEFAKALSTI